MNKFKLGDIVVGKYFTGGYEWLIISKEKDHYTSICISTYMNERQLDIYPNDYFVKIGNIFEKN